MRFTIIFITCLFYQTIFGQIRNTSFEFGSAPFQNGQVNQSNFWEQGHSPDWYKHDQYYIEENYGNGWVPVKAMQKLPMAIGKAQIDSLKQIFGE